MDGSLLNALAEVIKECLQLVVMTPGRRVRSLRSAQYNVRIPDCDSLYSACRVLVHMLHT